MFIDNRLQVQNTRQNMLWNQNIFQIDIKFSENLRRRIVWINSINQVMDDFGQSIYEALYPTKRHQNENKFRFFASFQISIRFVSVMFSFETKRKRTKVAFSYSGLSVRKSKQTRLVIHAEWKQNCFLVIWRIEVKTLLEKTFLLYENSESHYTLPWFIARRKIF